MVKKISALNYFSDIGVIAFIAIFGLFLGADKWLVIIGILLILLLQVGVTVYVESNIIPLPKGRGF